MPGYGSRVTERAVAGRPLDASAHASQVSAAGTHPSKKLFLAAALIAPFAAIVALLIVFQPFAGAAGGCGGG